MSYIGKTPATGNFVKLDAITTSSTNTYNLLKDSVAFTPESANHMIVSLNGVIQAPSTAFSVSGSQITFIPASGTLSSSDTIDFILVLGNVLDIGTPSDDTISTAKLQNTSVTAGKLATDSVEIAKIQNDAVTTDKINLISTSSTPSLEAKGTSGQTDGYIQLNCEQNSHGIKLKSPPHSAGQSYTLTFPSTAPANDKFLKTNSSGVLSFADAGGGTFTHLLTQTASNSSSLDFSSTYITTTYLDYMLVFSGIKAQSDGYYFRFLVSTDNGSSYLADYRNARIAYRDDGSSGITSQDGSSGLYVGGSEPLGNSTGEGISGIFYMFDPLKQSGTTDIYTLFTGQCAYVDQGGRLNNSTTGHSTKVTTAINNIRFDISSGNIVSGKISLYGRKLS